MRSPLRPPHQKSGQKGRCAAPLKGWHISPLTTDDDGNASFGVDRTKGKIQRETVVVMAAVTSADDAETMDRHYLLVKGWIEKKDYARLDGWFNAVYFTGNAPYAHYTFYKGFRPGEQDKNYDDNRRGDEDG